MLLFIAEKKQDRTKNVELNKKYNPLGTQRSPNVRWTLLNNFKMIIDKQISLFSKNQYSKGYKE